MSPAANAPKLLDLVPPTAAAPSARRWSDASVHPLPRLLPLLDPDHFADLAFYRELAAMGFAQVLLGGTGSARLREIVPQIRQQTELRVVLFPAGPDAVCEADLIVLPEIMNSSASHARPFGPGAVMAALAVARSGCPWLAAAHFIQGESTARWFFDAQPIREPSLLALHCQYAEMIGYRHIALDYEDPLTHIEPEVVARVKASAPRCHLTVSDEASPERARMLAQQGVDTLVLPSDVLQEASDPLALAYRYAQLLLD